MPNDQRIPKNIKNPALWRKVRAEGRNKFDPWPTAFASGWVSGQYEARGGTYIGGGQKADGSADDEDMRNFAYVPDEGNHSTWELPIGDPEHLSMAITALSPGGLRGNETKIPEADRPAVLKRIKAKINSMEMDDQTRAHLLDRLKGISGRKSDPPFVSEEEKSLYEKAYDDVWDDTGDEAKAEAAGLGAMYRSRMMVSVKSAKGTNGPIVQGYAILFTDEGSKDLQGEFFDEMTHLMLDYYPQAPLWMEHGDNPDFKDRPIGKRTAAEVDNHGVWLEHELHPADPDFEATYEGVKKGEFAYSTDSMGHYKRTGFDPETGRLGAWPVAGCSLTRQPAEPGLGPVKAKEFEQSLKSAAAKAREAQPEAGEAEKTDVRESNTSEVTIMDPIIAALSKYFGVEATAEAVAAALDQHSGEVEASGEASPELRAALGVEANAPVAEVVGKFAAIKAKIMPNQMADDDEQEPDEDDAQPPKKKPAKKSVSEYASLAQAMGMVNAASPNDMPYHTDGRKSAGSSIQVANYNKGAKLPGLAELVLAVHGKKGESAIKSLGFTVGPNGGWLVRREVARQVIELFYAKTAVFEAGATRVPMRGIESMTYRKMLTGATAYWRGEGQSTTTSDTTWGLVNLNLKELTAATRLNNRLLKNEAIDIEAAVRADIQKALSLKADLSFLRGTGAKPSGSSGAEPLGLRFTSGVTVTALATNGDTLSPKNMVDAWGRVEDANVPASDTWGVVCSPRTRRTIRNTTDLNGVLIPDTRFTDGNKVVPTTQISNALTVGTSTDCSEVYLGDWQYLVIGVGQEVEFTVDVSRYIEFGETYVQAIMMVDGGVSHPDAFQVLTGVRS